MPLPDLIEVVPLAGPVHSVVTVPGSKSITNRALVLAALSRGTIVLQDALWSEDTQVMTQCLKELGFKIEVAPTGQELSNRTITVAGLDGKIPRAGTRDKPLELFVGNAGTAARFLTALVCLGNGFYRLSGVERMHHRPQAALLHALRELGYSIDAPGNKLPALIHGDGPRAARCRVSIEESSQFASALLLCGGKGGWEISVVGENREESPYVAMTQKLIATFPHEGGRFHIEPDASSGSYFWGACWLLNQCLAGSLPTAASDIRVEHWPDSNWQIDTRFPSLLPLPRFLSREGDLGDSIMTAVVLAPFAEEAAEFNDLARLRLQECERVMALKTELTRCGARIEESGQTLKVFPSNLHSAEIETYQDHRMAMCFSILGLKVPGIKIKNPTCVKKTFPDFFQKLAAPPPHGLGATLLDGGKISLAKEDLFAG